LISCEHGNRRVSRTNPDGTIATVVDRYDGKRLNSPNDVVATPRGDLIFTDPPYGLRRADGSFGPQELPYSGVFRISGSDGALFLLTDDMDRPNGLAITADGSRLFLADTSRHHVRAFALQGATLTGGDVFCDVSYEETVGRPDGIKLDVLGNLYVTANTAEGVWVYDPTGALLGFISVGEAPANLAWGGDDWRTLFVTARTSVYRLQMKVAGQPVRIDA
jgi:gluconolactonase